MLTRDHWLFQPHEGPSQGLWQSFDVFPLKELGKDTTGCEEARLQEVDE